MNHKIKSFITLGLCIIFTVVLAACNKNSKKVSETGADETDIKLIVDEYYEINDVSDECIDPEWSFTTEDDSIAEVIRGKYIVSHDVGSTKITANMGDAVKVYNVTVEPDEDEDKLPASVPDVRDKTVYVGSGYNAFAANGYTTVKDLKSVFTLVKPETIAAAMGKDIWQDSSPNNAFIYIQGTSVDDYSSNYNNTISGDLKLDVKGIAGVGIEGKYSTTDTEAKKSNKAYTTILSMNQRYRFYFKGGKSRLVEMVKENPEAWNTLTGADGSSAEKCFDTYGTHILTEALVGGRVEFDYTLTSIDNKKSSGDLLGISGQINLNIASLKADASGKFDSSKLTSVMTSDITSETNVKIYGGASEYANSITDLATFATGYTKWCNSIKDDNVTFIGTTNDGLVPIWELLDPVDDEARIKELHSYYNTKMAQLNKEKETAAETTTAAENK